MELDETDNYLKDNLENIMNGEFEKKFTKEQLEYVRKESFMLNNITINPRDVTFEYGGHKICYKFDFDPLDFRMFGGDFSDISDNENNNDDEEYVGEQDS
jgi:hypothetical protein